MALRVRGLGETRVVSLFSVYSPTVLTTISTLEDLISALVPLEVMRDTKRNKVIKAFNMIINYY